MSTSNLYMARTKTDKLVGEFSTFFEAKAALLRTPGGTLLGPPVTRPPLRIAPATRAAKRPPPTPGARTILTLPDGRPLPAPQSRPARPPEPEPPPQPKGMVDVSVLSYQACQADLESIGREERILAGRLARLGDQTDCDTLSAYHEREIVLHRVNVLRDRCLALEARMIAIVTSAAERSARGRAVTARGLCWPA